ncbi:exodeoxyribonuclease III [Nitratireductor thuwali]|uniref:Exodeoxyribonuclease III n=1 Tax=Nitratireductor thuwali TaxID=2267699 RepID=A0ABY5MHH8_9HYPH|nr:Exodeoxyribonuclease III [Nitratireductor thuwali]
MSLKIATWNINSVRLRLPLVQQFLETHSPDVLCLQETKCPNDQFPTAAFRKLGYEYVSIHGQKGYHGVATISRRPMRTVETRTFCGIADCRHIATSLDLGSRRILLHNFYVPAGGDEPDPAINPKFRHKLDFIEEMHDVRPSLEAGTGTILVGDLNIAPLETDVWSHKQLLKVVSHTPVETEGLTQLLRRGAWVDLMRQHVPPEEKLFTWWSYRAKEWDISDRGRRLDHVWSSGDLAPALGRIEVLRAARGWERPSDHVPVIAEFAFG